VDLDIEGTPFPLGAAAELTAYRIVQEALTNTIRHASAGRARVTISYDEPCLRLLVADDGAAPPPDGHPGADRHPGADGYRGAGVSLGHGIDGMRERAALHGGTVTAGPAPDGGWLVAATLRPGQGTAAA
jgi:signal transduction histidine kinase